MTTENQPPDIIFKGIDGDECEAFVAALEDLAWSEGWTEDRRRMLFFARSRLRNAALRWFVRLDPSIKNDWDLFVQALFDQYPPVSNPPTSNEVGVATPIWSATTFSPTLSNATLSANPRLLSAEEDVQNGAGSGHPPNEIILGSSHIAAVSSLRSYDPSRLGGYVGRLRIVYEGEIPSAYVWRGKLGSNILYKANAGYNKYNYCVNTLKCVTPDRQDALIVSFRNDPEAHLITFLAVFLNQRGHVKDTSQEQGDLAVLLETRYSE
ncbi:hypothetical protein FRC04_010853 [Tulasnella sp. 424]|nr:hypothetical protein FRC04_010853 [Tulasnella sp. 424]KAG8972007.1 hypothetical protein FRC05_010420 [Tulasnella sp. 425]